MCAFSMDAVRDLCYVFKHHILEIDGQIALGWIGGPSSSGLEAPCLKKMNVLEPRKVNLFGGSS